MKLAVVRHKPRSEDDRVLFWLQQIDRGLSYGAIARRTGHSQQAVSTCHKAVAAADIAECSTWGDDPEEVREFWK
jgi:hypothetical protein